MSDIVPAVRKMTVGWQAMVYIHRRLISRGLDGPEDQLIVWRPTERWAVSVARRRKARNNRRWDRQKAQGRYAWQRPGGPR